MKKLFDLQVLKPLKEVNTCNEVSKEPSDSFERKQESNAHENTSTINHRSRKQVHTNNKKHFLWKQSIFSKFYGKLGVISYLLLLLICENYVLYWDFDLKN